MTRAAEKRRPTVCLLSTHPLVLGELQTILAKSSAEVSAVTLPAGWSEREADSSVPAADVFVLDGQAEQPPSEMVLSSVLKAHPQAAVVIMGREFNEAQAFPLLRLGARGLVRFADVSDQLGRAVEAAAAGSYWVPRKLLSQFVDSLVGRTGGGHTPAPAGGSLSSREQQVLDGLLENLSNKEIGARLHITERTVKFHVSRILAKFQVQRRADLILRFYQQNRPPQ